MTARAAKTRKFCKKSVAGGIIRAAKGLIYKLFLSKTGIYRRFRECEQYPLA
jgi:hypothetical protein